MKSQAEIAGHLTRGDPEHPQKGTVLRDLELLLADGTNDARRLLSSLRGRSNLVMIFTAGHDLTAFTAGLAGNAEALKEQCSRAGDHPCSRRPQFCQLPTAPRCINFRRNFSCHNLSYHNFSCRTFSCARA